MAEWKDYEIKNCKIAIALVAVPIIGGGVVSLIVLGALGYFNKGDEQHDEPEPCALSRLVLSGCTIDVKTLCNMGDTEFTASTFICNYRYGKLAKGAGVSISTYVKSYENLKTLQSTLCVPKRDDCEQHVCCTDIKHDYEICTIPPSRFCDSYPRDTEYKLALADNIIGCITASSADLCIGCDVDCEVFVYGHNTTGIGNVECLGNQSYHFANESALCPGLH